MERTKSNDRTKNPRRNRYYEQYTRFYKNKSSEKNTEKTGFISRTIVQFCICIVIFALAFFIKNTNSPLALQIKENLSKTINATTTAQDVSVFFNAAKEKYTNIKDMAISVFSRNNQNANNGQQNQTAPQNQTTTQNQTPPQNQTVPQQKNESTPSNTSGAIQKTNSELNIEKTLSQLYIGANPIFLNTVSFDGLDTKLNDDIEKEVNTPAPKIVNTLSSIVDSDGESEIYDFDTGEKRIDLPTNVNNDNLILPFDLNKPLNGSVTSKFGLRINPVTKKKSFHYGVDIGGIKGEYIVAPADGTIEKISMGTVAYGNSFIVNHSKGVKTFYGHCYKILVKVGQSVKAGQKIAQVGSTGWSTGPHLHFEIYKDGMILNPQNYFAFKYS